MIKDRPLRFEYAKQSTSLFSDLKALFKANVLIANILPIFTGFWLAVHFNDSSFTAYWDVFLLTLFGSTGVIAGALALNNWYDADIDNVMERTKHRPTVTGNIPLALVLKLGITMTILGFILLLFTSAVAAIYAGIGWFTYVFLYTIWSKRKYSFNTIIGSVSGAVTPLIGWAAVEPGIHIIPAMLALIMLFWQLPHTFAIAMKKCKEYQAAGVAMLPVVYGFQKTKRQMIL